MPAFSRSLRDAARPAGGASDGWDGDHYEAMGTWFNALMADTFA